MKYRSNLPWIKKLAKERIEKLFKQAEIEFKDHPELSNRYVEMAKKISTRYKVKIPHTLKRQFCKNCGAYFVVGKNLKVRINKSRVIYECLNCGKFMRFHLSPTKDYSF